MIKNKKMGMKQNLLSLIAVEAFLQSEDARLKRESSYADIPAIPFTNPYADLDKPKKNKVSKDHRHEYMEFKEKDGEMIKVTWKCRCGRKIND